jgi:hypothetical protein
MSEPSKEAMAAAKAMDLPYLADKFLTNREDADGLVAAIIDREFAALRARAEAADALASALRRIETGWMTMEADELSDIAREAIAAYEKAKEVKA